MLAGYLFITNPNTFFCFAKFYAQLPITCYIIHFLNVNHGKILRQICSALSPIFSLGNIGDCPLRYTVLF